MKEKKQKSKQLKRLPPLKANIFNWKMVKTQLGFNVIELQLVVGSNICCFNIITDDNQLAELSQGCMKTIAMDTPKIKVEEEGKP